MPHFRVNPRRIDIHLHTTASDGKLTVTDLIARCKQLGMHVIAITDHDTVKGVLQVVDRVQDGMTIIPGMELSAYSTTEPQIHLACYFPKESNLQLLMDELDSIVKDVRVKRCKTILEKLSHAGYVIPYSEIEEKTKDRYPSLPLIAECLVNHQFVPDTASAYTELIGNDAPCYEPVRLYSLESAIAFVHKYKGLCAVAHPWLCVHPLQVCEEAVQKGVDGLECYPPSGHSEHGTSLYRDICRKHNLFCSSGSDFHGITPSEVGIGDNIFPEEDADELIDFFKKHSIM